MQIDHKLLRIDRLYIQPALDFIATPDFNFNSFPARILMLGTGLIESDYVHFKQLGGGNALSYFQIERPTYIDMWENWLVQTKYSEVKQKLKAMVEYDKSLSNYPPHECLRFPENIHFAAAMCRLFYYRKPAALPPINAELMALYHKKHYNTHGGKTDVQKSRLDFEYVIDQVRW
jgi:hypothetical protein